MCMTNIGPFVDNAFGPQLITIVKVNKVPLGFCFTTFNAPSSNLGVYIGLDGGVPTSKEASSSRFFGGSSSCPISSFDPVLNALL
jgi:hypothetical protein